MTTLDELEPQAKLWFLALAHSDLVDAERAVRLDEAIRGHAFVGCKSHPAIRMFRSNNNSAFMQTLLGLRAPLGAIALELRPRPRRGAPRFRDGLHAKQRRVIVSAPAVPQPSCCIERRALRRLNLVPTRGGSAAHASVREKAL